MNATITPREYAINQVNLTRIDIGFIDLMVFFIKASLAAIPALFIVSIILATISLVLGLMGLGFLGALMQAGSPAP